ncbi:Bystin-domain-containing protein [Dipodascopsis uninucleata]
MTKSTKEDRKALYETYAAAALGDGNLKTAPRGKGKRRRQDGEDLDEKEDEQFVDAALSKKILQMAKEQQAEIEREHKSERALRTLRDEDEDDDEVDEDDADPEGRGMDDWEDEEEDDDDEEWEEFEREELVDLDNNRENELFEKFLHHRAGGLNRPVTLADKIMERLAEQKFAMKTASNGKAGDAGEEEEEEFPPKVVEVYEKVGLLLSRYRSGKLPKAFKIIPSLKNWQSIIDLTQPELWSSNACYEATKLFVSSLNSKQSQKFLSNVLLDRVREDIRENKTLNYHLYRSLKKSLYKPAAFFKGFLFPLCESGNCTLKEAIIVGSVLTKVSIPALHSSAALLRLADMETYSGANSLFMRVLIDKKYALPYKVVDGVVFHFLRFNAPSVRQEAKGTDGGLPLLWHKALLAFAQRYKNDITDEQREALLDLIKTVSHPKVTPEIRRELREGIPRESMTDKMQEDF